MDQKKYDWSRHEEYEWLNGLTHQTGNALLGADLKV